MSQSQCRWGILGTAFIAHKNWQAIRRAGHCTLTAVGSRDRKRAEQFIRECQAEVPFDPAPRACGSYEELLASADIDAVYIPLPTGVRKNWAVRAAEAGKHVMVEKPVGIDSAEVREIIQACQKHKVQFMDGVMFMHSQRLRKLRETLDDGQSVGKVRRIVSQFSFFAPDDFLKNNIRLNGALEPLGCLGDLGWYNVRFALWTMNYDLPLRVSGRILNETRRGDSPAPVPLEFSAEMLFDGGVSASFYCSFLTENQQWVSVSGSKGAVQMQDFVVPYYGCEVAFEVTNPILKIQGCNFNMEDHRQRVAVPEYSAGADNSQETHMFRNFSKLVQSGKLDTSWNEISLKTQLVIDACLKSARQNGAEVELTDRTV